MHGELAWNEMCESDKGCLVHASFALRTEWFFLITESVFKIIERWVKVDWFLSKRGYELPDSAKISIEIEKFDFNQLLGILTKMNRNSFWNVCLNAYDWGVAIYAL